MSDCVEAEISHLETGAARPTSVQELTEAERLVLWAFRRWVGGPEHLPMLAREFDRQFRRDDARPALIALDAALTVLSRRARRTITYHQPCCACLGADEVCFLSIVAAAQAGAANAARAMANWLVRDDGVASFIQSLDDFAECLADSGHDLPYRTARRTGSSRPHAMPFAASLVH